MVLDAVLDLERAFRRVQQDKRDDPWPDIVGYRDYRLRQQANIEELAGRIATHEEYAPSAPLGIDRPKPGFTLRPGVVPVLEDRIVYQAIADFLAPHCQSEPCVYSNRLSTDPNSRRMFVHRVRLWLDFQEAVAAMCHEYPYVVVTDITAYFEHIRHDLLVRRMDDLIRQLRRMGLYVASSKTGTKESEAVLDSWGEGRERIDDIEADLHSGGSERLEDAATKLASFFDEITTGDVPFDDRHFRYCINRFKRLRASGFAGDICDEVTEDVLARLESMPDSTDVFVDYLSLFPRSEDVQLAVLDFLEGPYNIYPWQEMTLLELLLRAEILPSCLDRTLAIARSSAGVDRHPACRAKALALWGKNGDYADRREIRNWYDGESRADIRRAIVVAIQEMNVSERDNFYNRVVSGSDLVRRTAEYVRSLPEPTYHYYDPPPGYDLGERQDDSDDLDELADEHLLY